VKLSRPDLAALVVLGVVVVAIAACAIFRVDVPSVLSELGILLAGIAGGAAIPTGTPSLTAAAAPEPSSPAPAPAPAPLPYAAAPGPWATDPAQTGAIPRIASHS
jgi:hypothetical protein